MPDMTDADQPESEADEPEVPIELRSGLRDPERAIVALGAIILGLEAVVLLMALVPLYALDASHSGWTIAIVLTLTAIAVALAGTMRRRWGWPAAGGFQVLVIGCWPLHWGLGMIGVLFGATWLYAMSVRVKLSRPPVRTGPPPDSRPGRSATGPDSTPDPDG